MNDFRMFEHREGEFRFEHKPSNTFVKVDGYYKQPNGKTSREEIMEEIDLMLPHLNTVSDEQRLERVKERLARAAELMDEAQANGGLVETKAETETHIVLEFYG